MAESPPGNTTPGEYKFFLTGATLLLLAVALSSRSLLSFLQIDKTFAIQHEYEAQDAREESNIFSAEVWPDSNAVEHFAAMDSYPNSTKADPAEASSVTKVTLPSEALAWTVSQRYSRDCAGKISSVCWRQQDPRAQAADYQLAYLVHHHKLHFDKALNLNKNASYKDYVVKRSKNQTDQHIFSPALTTALPHAADLTKIEHIATTLARAQSHRIHLEQVVSTAVEKDPELRCAPHCSSPTFFVIFRNPYFQDWAACT